MILCRLHLAAALALLLAASIPLGAQTTELAIKALDQRGRVLPGIRFAFGRVESLPTTDAGVTELAVPEMAASEAVKLDLPRALAEEWLLVDDETSYGPDHPDVAIDLNNLAQLLQATNRLSEAEPLRDSPGHPPFWQPPEYSFRLLG